MAGRQWTLGRGSLRGLALGLVAALVMVLGLCPAIALANDVEVEVVGGEEPTLATQGDSVLTPQDESPYGLYVGNVAVTEGKLSDDDWSFNPQSDTLTLNGYSSGDTTEDGIYYNGNRVLTIELKGTNTVKGTGTGIRSNQAGIGIGGNGTLTAEGAQYGILCNGMESTLEIVAGATVTAKATGEETRGISVGKDIRIGGATVTAEGGKYGIFSGGSLFIANSTVKASATNETIGVNGIFAEEILKIDSGEVTAESTASKSGVGVYAGSCVEVGKDVTNFIASGNYFAFDENRLVKNAVAGLGWMDVAGTGPKAGIRVSEDGQTLEYKRVQFPAPTHAVTVKADPTVTAHVQRIGWMPAVTDGGLAGTVGKSRRLEALTLKLPDGVSGSIEYCGHVQRSGWEKSFAADGKVAGSTGKSRRLEAVQIRLSGAAKDNYDVYYRVHVQRVGWMAWAKNGDKAGTEGMSRRMEAVQVALVPKDAPAPLATYKGVTQEYSKAFIKK